MRNKKDVNKRPVPLLSKIPFLKKLLRNFESRTESNENTEMVILITPEIVGSKSETGLSMSESIELPKKLIRNMLRNNLKAYSSTNKFAIFMLALFFAAMLTGFISKSVALQGSTHASRGDLMLEMARILKVIAPIRSLYRSTINLLWLAQK